MQNVSVPQEFFFTAVGRFFFRFICCAPDQETDKKIGTVLCRWFRFAQLAKGKKFRP
jgi:hypothetical protein